jgi:aspartate ammonia-lyase
LKILDEFMRTEKDSIGNLKIHENAYYGIHSLRGKENFIASGEKTNLVLIKAYLLVKKSAAITNNKNKLLDNDLFKYIVQAIDHLIAETDRAIEYKDNAIYSKIIVDPLQGGAGTSLNMNVNEVIANIALELMGKPFGSYDIIHPINHINLCQSTNDTYPTAVRVASLYLLKELQESYAYLQNVLQDKEEEFKGILKLGRTQFQDAVPITLGQEFGAYAQAFARDRWRLYNAEERLRSVNLGGTAVGNSINADRKYVLEVTNVLRTLTGLPIAKSEDLIESTQNLDVFVEVHGIIKAGVTSIQKMCNDLRFLSSGPNGGIGEINLPEMQAGSSIMPGKVNPVILEQAIQIAEIVKGNDGMISNLVSSGHLELNAFVPMIAHLFLKSISLQKEMNLTLANTCIKGITVNSDRCKQNLLKSNAIAATLIPKFGYEEIERLSKLASSKGTKFIDELMKLNTISEDELLQILSREIGIEIE